MRDRGRIYESRLDLSSQMEEGFLDVGIRLGRRLDIRHTELFGKLFCLLYRHDPLLFPVRLVADEDLGDAFAGVLFDVGVPCAHVLKRLLVGHVKDKQDAHRTSVVGCRDGAEPFLSRSVPDLQLDALPVQLDRADLKVNADGRNKGGCPRIVAEAQQETRLAHARVADQEQFDEKVIVWVRHGAAVPQVTAGMLDGVSTGTEWQGMV